MKLYEIAEGENIQITATYGKASAQYNTQIIQIVNNILLVEPIRHDGTIINFESDNVKMNVVYIQDGGKPITWENCMVKVMQYQKKKYHAIYSNCESKKLNRRQAFRQYVGILGTLVVDQSKQQIEVTVKDISTSGISFVGPPGLKAEDIGSFHLVYEDRDMKINLQISGNVVREEQVDESKKVFGCVIRRANVNLNSYVASKQKLEIAKRNGTANK
ncbi:MAG: PilZ domain-containing protein [Roseburia sp.]